MPRHLKQVGGPHKRTSYPLGSRHAFVRKELLALRRSIQTRGIAKENGFRHIFDAIPRKVFVDVHFELSELVNIDRFIVLPLCFTDESSLSGFKDNVKLAVALSESRRCKAKQDKRSNNRSL